MARALRIIAIVLMALTAVVTLLSGVGTVCAAFNPERYGATMAALVPHKWLYQVFVFVTIAVGLAAFWWPTGWCARGAGPTAARSLRWC